MQSQPSAQMIKNAVWKILIVDDDEEDFILTRAMLREAKGRKIEAHWINTFERGREALLADHYDAVLVDYDLGPRSGIDLIREANAKGCPAPLILFTGRGNYEIDVEAMEAGATLYLTKSEANPLLLERAIRYAMELKHKEQSLRASEAALRKSEAELRKSEALERARVAELNAVLDATPAIVWITHDPRAKEVEGNRASHELLRVPVGKNLSKSAPQDAPRNFRVFKEGRELAPEELPLQISAAAGQPIRNFEEEVVFDDGDRVALLGNVTPLLDDDGRPAGAVAAFLNITERKQAEQAVRTAEERFAKAFHSSPAALAITRASDGRYIEANESLCQIIGYHRDEVIGRTAFELGIYAEPAQRAELIELLRTQGSVRNYEVLVRTHSGAVRPMLGSYDIIELDNQPALLATLIDISERKQAEAALRDSEGRLRDFLENTRDSVCLLGYDWTILYANRRWAENTGRRIEDLIGKNQWEEFPRYVGTPLQEHYTKAMQERVPVHFQMGSQYSDKWYDTSVYPINEGIAIFAVDRTAELHTQHELQEAYARLRFFVDSNIVGIVMAQEEDGSLLEVNDYYLNLLGYTRAELEAGLVNWRALTPPEYLPRDDQAIAGLKATGKYPSYEKEYIRKDGERIWVNISRALMPDGTLAAFVLDITEQKQAEQGLSQYAQVLRASEERFRELADAMPQLVWTASADGTVDYYNQRYKEYDGIVYTLGDAWEWNPVLHPDDQQPTVDAWSRAVATGETYQIEHRVRMSDGEYCWHLSRGMPVKDAAGRILRWYGTATNIHAQKETEEKLRRSNQELEQFAFVASHDLQEPLRKIILFGNNLHNHLRGAADEKAEDYLRRMQSAAERMQLMIQGLLELSRINSKGGNFTSVDLNQLMADVVSDLEDRLQAAGGQVQVGSLPTIEADELQMRQLFQNLISNAVKFHKPGEPAIITISARPARKASQPVVEIQVADNGIGFEQKYAEQIFHAFQRLHGRSQYEGTGLGLAICKKIVERHHGEIEVTSSPNAGATFTIRLPTNLKK